MPSYAAAFALVSGVTLMQTGNAFMAPIGGGAGAAPAVRSTSAAHTSQLAPLQIGLSLNDLINPPMSPKAEREKFFTPLSQYEQLPKSLSTSEDLIGEILVTDDDSASKLADECVEEAIRLFDSQEGWEHVMTEDGVYIEQKDCHGAYAKSGVKVVRGVGVVDADADKFYNFQVSREGFQAIDEYLVNHRNVDNYTWKTAEEKLGYTKDDYELMMNRVEWQYPGKTREFVALDTIDRKRKILISKSALHLDRPGGSRYQDAVPKDEREFVRSVQYYASQITPMGDGTNRSVLRMVTWGEMCDTYSSWWVNKFNALVFITPKFDRFKRAMAGEDVFELNDIFQQAWKLPALLNVQPDKETASSSDFIKKQKVDPSKKFER